MSDNDLIYNEKDNVGHVLFNRPQTLNALTGAMYSRLEEICADIAGTRRVRALVLRGATTIAFSSGTDIAAFQGLRSAQDAVALEDTTDRVMDALERCPVPTVAAIAGACSGSGFVLAAACDLRIAAPNARFSLTIARTLGNCLTPAGYERLSAEMRPGKLKQMIFTAIPIDAQQALAMNFINEVVNDPAALADRADYIGRLAAAHAPLTLQATKEALLSLRPRTDRVRAREMLLACYASADFHEGVAAFLARREPHWRGA